jgi:hypothetical protein
MRRSLLALILVVALAVMTWANFRFSGTAHAAPLTTSLSPVVTNSYYVDSNWYANTNPDSYASKLGASDALGENQTLVNKGIHCTKGEYLIYTILDFGSPRDGNIYNWAGATIDYGGGPNQVWTIVEDYANSWYANSYNCFTLNLLIGVNNSSICGSNDTMASCDQAAGFDLATAVEEVNYDLATAGEGWQITSKGAIDAEGWYDPPYDYFGSYGSASNFADGFDNYDVKNGVAWNLYDFGDAQSNCYEYTKDWCEGPGVYGNVYQLAWGIGYDEPFPEAYSSTHNGWWAQVSSYSNKGNQGRIQYYVVMLSSSGDTSDWQNFINQNAGYIPYSLFDGSVQYW